MEWPGQSLSGLDQALLSPGAMSLSLQVTAAQSQVATLSSYLVEARSPQADGSALNLRMQVQKEVVVT